MRKAGFLAIAVASLVVRSHADTIITDFNSQNPLSFAYPGSTWATPANQFEGFTLGGIVGQEVVPLGGGHPTVSGGAGVLGLNLNASGDDGLQLTARLLPGNLATVIQVLLFDADGTILRFNYPISDFNMSTFTAATVTFSSATTAAAGSIPGFDQSHVKVFEVQGNFFDGGGTAPFQAQFDDLVAIGTPEPSSGALVSLGVCFVFALLRFKHPENG